MNSTAHNSGQITEDNCPNFQADIEKLLIFFSWGLIEILKTYSCSQEQYRPMDMYIGLHVVGLKNSTARNSDL